MINISIIMPLYNAERYLTEALQSISMQTYKDYELICINDASTDNTMEILRQFQASDDRINILENTIRAGAAVSRNRGISEAKGKYIAFLDGDDIFDEELLELCFKEIEKSNADVIMYEYMHVPSKNIYQKRSVWRSRLFIDRYCRQPFSIQDFEPIEFINWSTSPCNKLYRKSFICANKLEFQTLESANDVYFVSMALLLASKLVMLNDRRIMLYARDHNTPTRISYKRDPMCVYNAMEKVGERLVQSEIFENNYLYYFYGTFYHFCSALSKTKNEIIARDFYLFLQQKGINKILDLCERYNLSIDENLHNIVEKFRQYDFDTKWYLYEGFLKYYLNKNKQEIVTYFQTCRASCQKIAVWGVGRNGKILLDFLRLNNIRIDELIDIDDEKQGKIINGYVIKKPNDVLGKVRIIITSSQYINNDIDGLEEAGVKIINIVELLETDNREKE